MNDKGKPTQPWHLDKNINVGHILTTLTLAGAFGVGVMNLNTRLSEQDLRIQYNEERIESVDDRTVKALDKINDKLDRLIERDR